MPQISTPKGRLIAANSGHRQGESHRRDLAFSGIVLVRYRGSVRLGLTSPTKRSQDAGMPSYIRLC